MSHSHLTLEERIRIEIFVSMGLSCREMARRLGRKSQHAFPRAAPQRGFCKKRLSCAESRAACPQKAKESKALPLYESARIDRLG